MIIYIKFYVFCEPSSWAHQRWGLRPPLPVVLGLASHPTLLFYVIIVNFIIILVKKSSCNVL